VDFRLFDRGRSTEKKTKNDLVAGKTPTQKKVINQILEMQRTGWLNLFSVCSDAAEGEFVTITGDTFRRTQTVITAEDFFRRVQMNFGESFT